MARVRFQFRLRTLMIAVTVLALGCGYFAHEARVVHERTPMLEAIRSKGGYTTTYRHASKPPSPTWLRRILGDETVEVLTLPASTDNVTIAEIRRLFPDADLGRDLGYVIEPVWAD
jgi:hypothetical protein